MRNLLLITDVARLRNVFGCLTDDKTVHLRIANNLEQGGEELAIERPDVVFVQTHLSGLSAEILIMHLKKQLGRKSSRFVLLATPGQVNETILSSYQGWLDTSAEDNVLISDLHNLLQSITTKTQKGEETVTSDISAVVLPELSQDETPTAVDTQPAFEVPELPLATIPLNPYIQPSLDRYPAQRPAQPEVISAPVVNATSEPSLEEQGITYSPRLRAPINSEFNNSFDNALSDAPEPSFIANATTKPDNPWSEHLNENEGFPVQRSKYFTFLLWLAPVVITVIVATIMQHRNSQQKEPAPVSADKPVLLASKSLIKPLTAISTVKKSKPVLNSVSAAKKATVTATSEPAVQSIDKSVIVAITENNSDNKKSAPAVLTAVQPTKLPDFIPRENFDKNYSSNNSGWERYTAQGVDYRVYREKNYIKAIQVIGQGGISITKPLLNGILRQLIKNPVFILESSEIKENYRIERGHLASNLKVVYYRDEKTGKLRAFVIAWK